ncbi:glutathione S-transferase family protein [Roseibium salinum]|uniref:Glutathione S-transferase family protein n=1 Tax=Roseibium salinum TaxID=1604349 RepID=A0ABT3QYA7_9HYPH|nr:glutathione S-transferase family protein [Roseibium sp. DSM 29163]MCX2721923.1 glutathione S-transferase family protein [Roseibium sp. DSM 29163]MDN3720040.1 glutathione S-transferase family protein [Roseibium salinum]
MKFYTNDFSPNCRRVEAVLYHLGLHDGVETHRLNLAAGEHMSDEMRTANPNMKVPTLVIADMKLWEANPMMIYLCDRAGAEAFCPSDLNSRFEILRWMSWEVQHYNRALGEVIWETIVKPSFDMGEPDQAKIDAGLENYRRFAAVLNDRLSGRNYILGDKVTVTDFAVGAPSAFALHPQSQIPLQDYPNVEAWYQRLESLPAWSKTAPPRPAAEAAE